MGHEVVMEGTTASRVEGADASDAPSAMGRDVTSCTWHRATHGCSMVISVAARQIRSVGLRGPRVMGKKWG